MLVLLIEDDIMIGENIKIALESEEIQTDWAINGQSANAIAAEHDYDAVLLDLGLPDMDGLEIIRSLRVRNNNVPLMVITARDTVPERVSALNLGADDYLIKPFDLDEMIARLKALVRRSRNQASTIHKKGDIVIDVAARQAWCAGTQVPISGREWAILDALLARPGAILSRGQLEWRLYGWSEDIDSNAVEVHIHSLRKKLGPDFIVNTRGLGYSVAIA